jgi:hypothetical protein
VPRLLCVIAIESQFSVFAIDLTDERLVLGVDLLQGGRCGSLAAGNSSVLAVEKLVLAAGAGLFSSEGRSGAPGCSQIRASRRKRQRKAPLCGPAGRCGCAPCRSVYSCYHSCLYLFAARRSTFVGAVRSGLGPTRKFATVALDWLGNLRQWCCTGSKIWYGLVVASWTGSKMWHGVLVAFGLARKFGTDCWWRLELTRKSWTDSRSSHGLLVLERGASEKRGTSSGKMSSMRGVQEGGEEGVEEGGECVTRERSGIKNTAASGQGMQECRFEPPPGPSASALARASALPIRRTGFFFFYRSRAQ